MIDKKVSMIYKIVFMIDKVHLVTLSVMTTISIQLLWDQHFSLIDKVHLGTLSVITTTSIQLLWDQNFSFIFVVDKKEMFV
jgi:hypothetical protein